MELPGFVPSWSAEFPNDNPALHEGASWLCLQVCGAPRPVTRARTVNVRSDIPRAEVIDAKPAVTVMPNGGPPIASIEGGNMTNACDEGASRPEEEDAVPSAGWDDEAPSAVAGDVTATAGLDEDSRSALCDEAVMSAGLDDDARGGLAFEAPAVTAGWDADASAMLTETGVAAPAKAPSLEALTLSLPPEVSSLSHGAKTSREPLTLDAMDFVTTLGADDPVFEFDGDDATGAVFHVPRVAEISPSLAVARAAEERVAADSFTAYIAALVDVAQAAGHARAASALPLLLEGDEFDGAALAEDTRARLVAAGVLRASEGSVRLGDAFASTASAWRSVLRGATQDLSICGDSTLDGWSAELLKAFGVGQGTATDVRRELRRRGVAAFGMLLAA